MNNTKRITKTATKIIADSQTGEILHSELSTTSVVPSEPNFVKMYVQDISTLLKITKSDNAVLLCLLRYMNYENVVYLVIDVKKDIMKDINMPLNTLNDSIRNLREAGIIIRHSLGKYIINPTLFARGRWENINKIKLEIEYSSEGRKITHHVDNKHITLTENGI